jgi:hypothetical protein
MWRMWQNLCVFFSLLIFLITNVTGSLARANLIRSLLSCWYACWIMLVSVRFPSWLMWVAVVNDISHMAFSRFGWDRYIWLIRLIATTHYHFTMTGSPSSKQRCNLGASAAKCLFTSKKPVSLWFFNKIEKHQEIDTPLYEWENRIARCCHVQRFSDLSTKLPHVRMKDLKGKSDCLGRINTLAALVLSVLLAETSSNYCGAAEASARLCFWGGGSLRKISEVFVMRHSDLCEVRRPGAFLSGTPSRAPICTHEMQCKLFPRISIESYRII